MTKSTARSATTLATTGKTPALRFERKIFACYLNDRHGDGIAAVNQVTAATRLAALVKIRTF